MLLPTIVLDVRPPILIGGSILFSWHKFVSSIIPKLSQKEVISIMEFSNIPTTTPEKFRDI